MNLSAPTRDQFTTTAQSKTSGYANPLGYGVWNSKTVPGATTFDQNGYNTALSAYESQLANAGTPEGFGSLLDQFTGQDLAAEPGYAFGLGEGEKALQRGASRNGMRLSPATMKALLRFNEDYAGTKYNDAFTRDLQNKQNTFNMLSGVSGTGQAATSAGAQLGQQSTSNIGNYLTQGGNAQAAGIVGSANSIASGISGAGNAVQNQYWLNQFLNQKSAPSYGASNMYAGPPQ